MTKGLMDAINEVYRPRSPDEQKFVDKHVTVKNPDRNGNGDDVFNAKNIKTIDRKSEGHGYNVAKDGKPGEDEQVYERRLTPEEEHEKDEVVDAITRQLPEMPLTKKVKIAKEQARKVFEDSDEMEELEEISNSALMAAIGKARKGVAVAKASQARGDGDQSDYIKKKERLLDKGNRKLDPQGAAYRDWRKATFDDKKTTNDNLKYQTKLRNESVIDRVYDKFIAPKVIDESKTLGDVLANKLSGLHEMHSNLIFDLFDSLDEDNQIRLCNALDTDEGINEVLDFVIRNRGE